MIFRHRRAAFGLAALLAAPACATATSVDDETTTRTSQANIIPIPTVFPPIRFVPDVLTQRNDNKRSGAQLREYDLAPSNVSPSTFGRLYTRTLDAQVLAQPLYASRITVGGVAKDVVYVATARNTVYAFDANNASTVPSAGVLHQRTLRTAPMNTGCSETMGPIGITSTPTIDKSANAMYVTSMGTDGYWIHKLSLSTLDDVIPPQHIAASVSGVTFDANVQRQRPGILLSNGYVYLGFGTRICDNGDYHGWVLAYDSSLSRVGAWVSTPGSGGAGGIWQSGNGLAADDSGNIYFATGNGTVDPAHGSYGNSIVRLTPQPAHWWNTLDGAPASFHPANSDRMNAGDVDLGSGGVAVLPGGRVIGGGKSGEMFLLDQGTLALRQNFQAFYNEWHSNWFGRDTALSVGGVDQYWTCNFDPKCFIPVSDYDRYEVAGPNMHGGMVYWKPNALTDTTYLYGMPEKEYLKAYAYHPSTGAIDYSWAFNSGANRWETQPAMRSHSEPTPNGMPGGAISISANGGTNGIVWASYPKVDTMWDMEPGRLVAYDASTLAELWRDDDDVAFAKFNPPMIAGGRVYRPTFGKELIVYGHASPPPMTPCYTIAQKYAVFGGSDGSIGNATTGENVAPDGTGHYQHFNGSWGERPWGDSSIYWTPTTCAQSIRGGIRAKWSSLGWERFFGYPTTDETPTPDQYGRYNHFQWGSIYWTPKTDAHEIHGSIRDKWSTLGWERFFGYPTTDESTTPDGIGRYNHFDGGGSIYWTPSTGAHEIHGPIRDKWASLGWETNPALGYPISDVVATYSAVYGSGSYSQFQHGYIYWYPSTGAFVTH